jgi:hypothetical protein
MLTGTLPKLNDFFPSWVSGRLHPTALDCSPGSDLQLVYSTTWL